MTHVIQILLLRQLCYDPVKLQYLQLTEDCSPFIEVRLEAAGLASDPLNSVVNKIAT